MTRVIVSDDVSDDFKSGTARTIEAENPVKGPVTGVNPLQMLDAVQFFNAIDNGTPVQVESCTCNPWPDSITAGQIEIED